MCRVPIGPLGCAMPVVGGRATLEAATDRHGESPRRWLAGALRHIGEPVLDVRLATISGDRLELRGATSAVLARPDRLPVRTDALAGVAADMCLPAIADLHELFAELRRVLRPAGTLAATVVPCRMPDPLAAPGLWWPLRRAVGGRPGFVNRSAQDQLGWLLTAADFAVVLELRRTFRLPLPDRETAARVPDGLVAAGVWPPDLGPDRLAAARSALTRFAAPNRTMPIPVRLLVARR